MKTLKIIFITHSSKNGCLQYCDTDSDEVFVASWAGLFARRLKKYNPKFDIESWIMEPFAEKKISKNVYGLKGVIWPFRYVLIKNVLSLAMYIKLLKLSFKYRIILHYHNIFDRFVLIRFFLPPSVKIVLSHHGGIPPKKNSIKDLLVKFFYKCISAITYINPNVKNYLIERKISESKLFFLPVGVDFNYFTQGDKLLARKKLDLKQNFIYAIYVGKFYRLKSVDLILQIYEQLKNKYNFQIIFVGGDAKDELFEEVKNSGCPYFFYQKYINMPVFYHAADFYIHPTFNPQFGGLDISWMEALACNIPVLSSRLSFLDFDYSELGICLNNQSEVIEKTEWMINNFHKFTRCREIAQKYLDGNNAIMEKLIKIYNFVLK